jgi:glutamyl-tRNA reductase
MILLEKTDWRQPLDARERSIAELPERESAQSVVLQTCNRVEVYTGEGLVPPATVLHLFRVAAGLESHLVGETAVLGQVKQAYRQAAASSVLPKGLHQLFQAALKTGKRVRAETGLSRGAVGHSQAAVSLLRARVPDLSRAQITILGVNQLNRSIVKYLVAAACKTIFLSTRSLDKAQTLGQELGVEAFPLTELARQLTQTDVLICATSAPHAVVRHADVPLNRDLVIVDLAVPRDVEPAVGNLPRVRLFNLEDVEALAISQMKVRTREISAAERIVAEEVEGFLYAQA